MFFLIIYSVIYMFCEENIFFFCYGKYIYLSFIRDSYILDNPDKL